MDWDSFNAWGTGNVAKLRAYIGHLHRVRDDAHDALRQIAAILEDDRRLFVDKTLLKIYEVVLASLNLKRTK